MTRGRKPSVRYWESRGGYCATIRGVQYTLAVGPDDYPGPTRQAAHEAFNKLFSLELNKGTDGYLVSACLEQYAIHLKTKRVATGSIYASMVRPFPERFGHLAVS